MRCNIKSEWRPSNQLSQNSVLLSLCWRKWSTASSGVCFQHRFWTGLHLANLSDQGGRDSWNTAIWGAVCTMQHVAGQVLKAAWSHPGHTGELLPVGSYTWLPMALAIQWIYMQQNQESLCPSVVETWPSASLGGSVHSHYTTAVVTECVFGTPWHRSRHV